MTQQRRARPATVGSIVLIFRLRLSSFTHYRKALEPLTHDHDSLPLVLIDAGRVRELVRGLLDNARIVEFGLEPPAQRKDRPF